MNFDWVSNPSAWVGLLTLIALEIVLGIDNIVFISILSGKLPLAQQPRARKLGLLLAIIPRVLLLLSLGFVLRLEHPLFYLPFADPEVKGERLGISGQDLIVIIGGLFLLAKSTHEIHHKLEGAEHAEEVVSKDAGGSDAQSLAKKSKAAFIGVLVQISLLNIVFSLDSIITAIGMVDKSQVMVMIIAVLVATAVMAVSVNAVSAFVARHPTVKMLALSFLLLIGMTLLIEGFHAHIPKGYVYFAMGFSVLVEVLNLQATKRRNNKPVHLREPQA